MESNQELIYGDYPVRNTDTKREGDRVVCGGTVETGGANRHDGGCGKTLIRAVA
jgi:hypothetical protein